MSAHYGFGVTYVDAIEVGIGNSTTTIALLYYTVAVRAHVPIGKPLSSAIVQQAETQL